VTGWEGPLAAMDEVRAGIEAYAKVAPK